MILTSDKKEYGNKKTKTIQHVNIGRKLDRFFTNKRIAEGIKEKVKTISIINQEYY